MARKELHDHACGLELELGKVGAGRDCLVPKLAKVEYMPPSWGPTGAPTFGHIQCS